MFGKRRFNGLFGDFDSMFNELNSMFNDNQYYVTGKRKVASGTDENGDWTKESFTSNDGTYMVTTVIRGNTNYNKTKPENNKTYNLKVELERAVEEQEFEKAAKLRDQIKSIELNTDKINKLKSELDESISNQDFETAIKLRDKIKNLEK